MVKYPHPLRHCTYILLGNHGLQMIFLRQFYDEKRRVNTKNNCVWGIHFIFYCYVIYAYYFSGKLAAETSDNIKIWIPLDVLLTFNITLYQIYYNWEQSVEDEKKKIEEEEKRLEGEEMTPANINSSLLGESPDRMNTSVNMSMNTSVIGAMFGSLKKKKTKAVESIYACNEPKVKTFKL